MAARIGTAQEHAAGGLDLFDDGEAQYMSMNTGDVVLTTPARRRAHVFHVPLAAGKSDDETENDSVGAVDLLPTTGDY